MRKFAFDTSFDDPDTRVPAAGAGADAVHAAVTEPVLPDAPLVEDLPPAPTFSAEELQAARAAAWSDGMAAGREDAEAGLVARQNRLVDTLLVRLGQLEGQMSAARQMLATDTVRIGVAVVKALYPHSFREESRHEILHAVRSVITEHDTTVPPLQLTCAVSDAAWLEQMLTALGSHRFRLRQDDAMMAGDFRLEWTDGGIERHTADIWARITALVPATPTTDDTITETDQ